MSKDTNEVLGHADESDGIEEYDNPLPDWWVGLLWLTVIWAIGYSVHYHFIADRSQVGALAAEMAAAEVRYPAQAAASVAAVSADFAVTPEAIAAGETVFNTQCFACHLVDLSGSIGPSFLDEEWIHGGQAVDIINTIIVGVPEKGMVPWGQILSPVDINNVAAYIISKHSEATGRPIEEIVGGG
ncbi:MAG: hypothetical protein HN396_12040 [Gemmatimonadales bacterium]|jgi:cytochrome c oxidase cbb3-type subunit 3|nr:hypothetical protein [Gemmatimonadales bacterium]MBT3500533.1 hypothetical protein [Gemmatimonadales bacterium]MBT3775172.1 hypothetical protein [Gemmatimonadales bacterium]MBT3959898.1 hypothetical protein [Gemmatimonadales bacterium]MBT4436296.1 hypothetical protein [Gemmatimonadales bacterium]